MVCYGCEKRSPTCHCSCPKYIAFQAICARHREQRKQEGSILDMMVQAKRRCTRHCDYRQRAVEG